MEMCCSVEPSSKAWYVVQTKPRQESRARDNLRRQGFHCLLPLLQVEKIRRGKRLFVNEPLFARYIFVELVCTDQDWGTIRSTRGVIRLVQFGGVPAKLPEGWVEGFLSRDRKPVRLFDAGQRVLVTDGPFTGLEGIYQLADGETRAIVLFELLEKPCKGTFAVEALRRVA
jgi:transcriptional antiterminator RfaH